MFLIKCKIWAGAFSGEKKYSLEIPGVEFESIGHPFHFVTADLARRLTKEDAKDETKMEGYVECRPLHSHVAGSKTIAVNLPSGFEGETLSVPLDAVLRGAQVPNFIE